MPAWSIGCRCSTSRWKRCSIISTAARSPSSRWPRRPRTSGSRRSPIITRRARKRSIIPARGAPYKPLPPDRLYLAEAEWRERLDKSALARLTPFAAPPDAGRVGRVIDIGAHAGHNFTAERATPGANVFEAVGKHVQALQAAGKRVADRAVERRLARAHGACARASTGLLNLTPVASWPAALGFAAPRRWRSRCSASNPVSRPPMSR